VIVVFSSLDKGVVVWRHEDGSYSWSGKFKSVDIRLAVPIENGERCVLILDPDSSTRSRFENMICIDRIGDINWIAKLPTNPDVFLDVQATDEGLVAKTWSGFKLILNPNTGAELERTFVK
jgi:hypothetical protein